MAVKLATPEAFRSANIDFNPALLSLRFAVEQRGGRQIIRVTSSQPLNEPFVDMLLELTWNNGRLVREYTFLLDPAELRTTQPAQVASSPAPRASSQPAAAAPAAAAAAAAPAFDAAERARIAAAREGAQRQAAQRDAAAAESAYRVRRGDTLSGIATQREAGRNLARHDAGGAVPRQPGCLHRQQHEPPEVGPDPECARQRCAAWWREPGRSARRGRRACGRLQRLPQQARRPGRRQHAGQRAAGRPERNRARSRRASKNNRPPPTKRRTSCACRRPRREPAPRRRTAPPASKTRWPSKRELEQAEARVKELEKNVSELENLMTVPEPRGRGSRAGCSGARRGDAGHQPGHASTPEDQAGAGAGARNEAAWSTR